MKEFNYLREKVRMLRSLEASNDCENPCPCNNGANCLKCPLSASENRLKRYCVEFEIICPDEATEIVRKWAEEHPRKTRKDVLLEKFPNAKMDERGIPYVCAIPLRITAGCCFCEEGEDCAACWDIEVEE